MFLAIDRVTKFTHVAFFDANTKMNGSPFLREAVAAFPYRIHTVLTDNGMAFADLPQYRGGPTARWMGHIFDRVCRENGIEHRLTKPYHPWTNGQAERMNRTVKEATTKAFHYPSLDVLKAHVLAFVRAYNFAKHLKALRWRTPFQAICDAWASIRRFRPRALDAGTRPGRPARTPAAGLRAARSRRASRAPETPGDREARHPAREFTPQRGVGPVGAQRHEGQLDETPAHTPRRHRPCALLRRINGQSRT
jgi:hypothetical protein